MASDRPPYGPLVSAVGAIVLAVSVFLPWYGVSLTANGVAFMQQFGDQVVSRFGNSALQSELGGFHADLSRLAHREIATISAHDALTNLHVVLLILAGVAIAIALVALAGLSESLLSSADGHRAPLVLLGAVSAVCVLYRIIAPPVPSGEVVELSLHGGAWLALVGSLAVSAGALWPSAAPRPGGAGEASDGDLSRAFSALSGWTPGG